MLKPLAFLLTLLCAAVLAGQPTLRAQETDTPSASKVERKNRAPVSRDMLRVKLPKPVEAKLKNGLTVLVIEDHRAPFVSIQLHIGGAGALFEPAQLAGLASTTAQMLREGTKSRTSIQISEAIDRLGASLGAGSSFGSSEVVLSASGLSDNFDAWFEIVLDVLLNPSFPADELEKLKQRQRVQLRQQRSSANFLASERFNRAVYNGHPAAIVSQSEKSVDALTREILAQWHRERYGPQDAILGVAGNVRAPELIKKLEKSLGGWKASGIKEAWPRDPVAATARKVFLVDRLNSVQTTVALGNIAIERRSPDYFPMVVMNHVIGAGSSGRLFLNLREEKGYTYGVYSDFSALRYPGPWRAVGNMRTEVTEPALVEFFNEIRRIRDEPVPAAELEASKRAIAASFALSLEQPSAPLNFAIVSKRYGLAAGYWDDYPAKIMAVSAADVRRVARKYLNPETMQLVAVGDREKIKAALEKYGPVEVYDAEGRRVP
ncbi:MAG TPA: pitrilysin family protein [Candidatus Binatia bacterium]|jgi:zinc protease